MILALESQLEESQEREKMLVQYPDLNPGLSKPPEQQGMLLGWGGGRHDQENTVKRLFFMRSSAARLGVQEREFSTKRVPFSNSCRF